MNEEEEIVLDQQIARLLSIPIDKRTSSDIIKIRAFIEGHKFHEHYRFRNEGMQQISMHAQLQVYGANQIVYQQNDVAEKLFIILKGQVGIYFPKEFKQRYEDLRNSLSDDMYKYPVSEYKKLLFFIRFQEKDSWFGELGLVNHSIEQQVAITESDVYLMTIDQKYFQRYIYEKELNFLKKKLRIFQNNLFSDCSVIYQRLMYYMSSKKTFVQKQSVQSEAQEIENIFIIKKGEFGVYKFIYDENSMIDQLNNPLKQVSHPTEQFMRKKNKDNKKYSKNTKLKVVSINDVVGEHDVIMRRKANYSCLCESYDGGLTQAIPALIFLYVIQHDQTFDHSLKEKLKLKMIDFNDRVHKISTSMQKFGDFFFFKSRKVNDDQAYVKQGTVFEIDQGTKKITKINVNEGKNNTDSKKHIEEIKEIKSMVDKMQQEQEKDQDQNDFNYFPFNTNIHQKLNFKNTLPISCKDLENQLVVQRQPSKSQEKKDQQQVKVTLNKSPSQRQSHTLIPESMVSLNNTTRSFAQLSKRFIANFPTQKSLQELQFNNKLQDNDTQRKYFSSQRTIVAAPVCEDENINNISAFDLNNNNVNINNKDQNLESSLEKQNVNNISRTSLELETTEQKASKSPQRSQSRRTIIIHDHDLINEEEENHHNSSHSGSSIQKSFCSPIVQQIKKDSNTLSIQTEKERLNSLSSQSPKQLSPLLNDIKRANFQRKQKKALTLQSDALYGNRFLSDVLSNEENIDGEKRKNMFIDEDQPLQYFEHREGLSPDNKLRGRQTHSVYQKRKSEVFSQNDKRTPTNKNTEDFPMFSKKGSRSRIMDQVLDELYNGNSYTPKNATSSSGFSNRNLKPLNKDMLNSKITDKFLLKAIGDTQNMKNEILNQKDMIQVSDLKTSKFELKSLIEIKNLQKKMSQKQDPTKYDDRLKKTQMRVLDLNIKLSSQKNKSFLEEERQRQEQEQNSIYQEQKEQIIRKHISKIGLVSPTKKRNSKPQVPVSPSNSISMNESILSGVSKDFTPQSLQNKLVSSQPISYESVTSPLNHSMLKSTYNEQQNLKSKKPSQFNIQAYAAAHSSSQNSEVTHTQLPQSKSDDLESPIHTHINTHINVDHRGDDQEEQSDKKHRSSFINYNDYAFSSPQHYNPNRTMKKLVQRNQYTDPLNIGLKQNMSAITQKHDHFGSYHEDDSFNSPHAQTGTHQQKNGGKKNKIHFKNSVDEYLELKARALSNNFDKKKIKQKDLPFLDSYANQLQINLKRLFYLKLKENYCKDSGFENVQQRVANQMLDQNFKQFLKNTKDILPERRNLNYLYNWRSSESPKKSFMEKFHHQIHPTNSNPNQDFLKGNIPVQGFYTQHAKLPNLYKRQKPTTENVLLSQNLSSGTLPTSTLLDKHNQSVSKFDSLNGGLSSRNNLSTIFQNEGREKIITERARQFYDQLQSIQEKKNKEKRDYRKLNTIEFKQTAVSMQHIPAQAHFSSIPNLETVKKMSYKEFQEAYNEDATKLQDMQNQARNDLINLDKFYKTNQRASDVLHRDNQLIKKQSLRIEDTKNQASQRSMPSIRILQQSTDDIEDDLFRSQNDNNIELLHERVIEEEDEDSPIKQEYYTHKISSTHYNTLSSTQSLKTLVSSPSRYRIQPNKDKLNSIKINKVKSVEEEMKELTHSIILKYGLQSKFKTKHFK